MMNLIEAQMIHQIVLTADNQCLSCARELILQLQEAFQEFQWSLQGVKLKDVSDS